MNSLIETFATSLNLFLVDASVKEQEIVDFLHSNGIVETCKIYSPKENWFKVYHYIQLVGEEKLKYMYVKSCGGFEGSHELRKVSIDEFKTNCPRQT
jgi:hypothetical protein